MGQVKDTSAQYELLDLILERKISDTLSSFFTLVTLVPKIVLKALSNGKDGGSKVVSFDSS